MVGKHEQYIPHPVEPTASGILSHWIPLVIPSGSHGRWRIAFTPERTQPVEPTSNRTGWAREGTRGRRGERSRKEGTQGDPAHGGHMKIFLGMPKTETRAGQSSLPPPPRPREGTPVAALCVTSEIAVISR